MFRLSMRLPEVSICLVLAFVLASTQPAMSKCISLQVTVDGEIIRSGDNLTVSVGIQSATPADLVTEVRQKSSITGSRFNITAWFNTTSNVIREETCDRRPHLVTVKLARGKDVLDQQTLTVETDFHRTKDGDYELVKPLRLHASPAR